MLGAACGDALGWPNEFISQVHADKVLSSGSLLHFRSWNRQAGGRFHPHHEKIKAGSYSDDTQLILCLARSLQFGKQWQKQFCEVELPFWLLYERGGGRATKQSARTWASGIPPWSDKRSRDDIRKYLEAGGNGVAMRIMPHVLFQCEAEVFSSVAQNILLDGIATHGHPRALVGALTYGYALWTSLHKTGRLRFGEVVDALLDHVADWSSWPASNADLTKWRRAACKHLDYALSWDQTVNEMTDLLQICRERIAQGVIATDEEVLQALNCYDRNVGGAGTITAAAAVYLASRHASDPIKGIIQAAYAFGTDTDTIASMTGGLLGIISGWGWLSPLRNEVQDAAYLERMATTLVTRGHGTTAPKAGLPETKSRIGSFRKKLVQIKPGTTLDLPDGRMGRAMEVEENVGKTGKFKVFFVDIACEDRQTLRFSKIVKISLSGAEARHDANGQTPGARTVSVGIKLPVEDLKASVGFYRDILNLKLKKQSDVTVVFAEGLVLVAKDYQARYGGAGIHSLIYVDVDDIAHCLSKAMKGGFEIVTPLSEWKGSDKAYFRCKDPSGNIVEVFSTKVNQAPFNGSQQPGQTVSTGPEPLPAVQDTASATGATQEPLSFLPRHKPQ